MNDQELSEKLKDWKPSDGIGWGDPDSDTTGHCPIGELGFQEKFDLTNDFIRRWCSLGCCPDCADMMINTLIRTGKIKISKQVSDCSKCIFTPDICHGGKTGDKCYMCRRENKNENY